MQKIPEELTNQNDPLPAKIIHSAIALRGVESTRAIAAVWVAQVAIVFFTKDATPLATGACKKMLGVSCAWERHLHRKRVLSPALQTDKKPKSFMFEPAAGIESTSVRMSAGTEEKTCLQRQGRRIRSAAANVG